MIDADLTGQLQARIQQAGATGTPLRIAGGGSKRFYGRPVEGEVLDMTTHRGVVQYEPTELVITARAGTPLAEIEALLAENGQMLAFEPPYFAPDATIGGTVATGLAGPRRPWGGAPRDHLLGVRLLDGKGQHLRFGGEVMKNVAGYDVSRLMAGAQGTLGILLEVSLKVLPRPLLERTQIFEMSASDAIAKMREFARKPVPLSGACHLDGKLHLRLSGNEASVTSWEKRLGPDQAGSGGTFWLDLRDHRLGFFRRQGELWRFSIAPASPAIASATACVIDWAGAQRWIYTGEADDTLQREAAKSGGHAECFRGTGENGSARFAPLPVVVNRLHERLKQTFDPQRLLNPGRLYPGM